MRLLVKMEAISNSKYDKEYHYNLQGFIYGLIKKSSYHDVHDKKGYKFFCFSNIFPVKDLRIGEEFNLLISSPDLKFIDNIEETIKRRIITNSKIQIGSMVFQIESTKRFEYNFNQGSLVTMITGTPIIVRIPRDKYKEYQINPPVNYDYIFWKNTHPVNLFIQQIENNLLMKYSLYYKNDIVLNINKNFRGIDYNKTFIQQFRFKKQIATKINMKGSSHIIIGSLWEFTFNIDINREVFRFVLDVGLGERNSLGFGFMNIKVN